MALGRKLVAVGALAMTGVAGALAAGGDGGPAPAQASARLERFGSCQELLDYGRRYREAMVRGPSRAVFDRGFTRTGDVIALESAPAGEVAAASATRDVAQAEGPEAQEAPASATNVQEAGVDEPDIVETDGERIFAIAGDRLHAVDAAAADPRLAGSLSLPKSSVRGASVRDREMFLSGDSVLVLSRVEPRRRDGTLITEVDVSDPAAMRVTGTFMAEGRYVTARVTGSTARVVVSASPDFRGAADADADTTAPSGQPAWMPVAVARDRLSGAVSKRPLAPCDSVRRPEPFSGVGMLTVLTIDVADGLPPVDRDEAPVDSDAVMTAGETVYASEDRLYVATEQWSGPIPIPQGADVAPPPEQATAIHSFDTSQTGVTEYSATGEVAGRLLNQFSMSEHDGFLRAASTADAGLGAGGSSESLVTVLEERGNRLVEVGKVGRLGRGEEIYAVRFIGDIGYVVTFRQVDPLYTIDLSDPTDPRVRGELKIRGYSAYFHPVGDDLLLGIGQDATKRGFLRGTQISLFDVSDLDDPVRLHVEALGAGARSEAEFDHHAFLYWAPEGLAVVPVRIDGRRGVRDPFAGAIAYRVEEQGIDEVGRVVHEQGGTPPVQRSLVIGDRLYTVSESGIEATDPTTLADQAWVPF